jgi:hypothetical protein
MFDIGHDRDAVAAAQAIRDFIAIYDRNDPEDRVIAVRIHDRLQCEVYRREREHYAEWIDHGGEG